MEVCPSYFRGKFGEFCSLKVIIIFERGASIMINDTFFTIENVNFNGSIVDFTHSLQFRIISPTAILTLSFQISHKIIHISKNVRLKILCFYFLKFEKKKQLEAWAKRKWCFMSFLGVLSRQMVSPSNYSYHVIHTLLSYHIMVCVITIHLMRKWPKGFFFFFEGR